MEEKKRTPEIPHQLTLSNRNLLGVDGVTNLGSFDEEKIILETSKGVLEIKGERLHVQQLNLDQGKVLLDGEFHSLAYVGEELSKKSKGFFSNLMK
ncbi:sporulation protein YabP [Hydrogenispora ethanolica]|uniref:Sporulation protein YabP n=1 Tax=Hydrogenispora ethanolica TaxID=1082276 RepID=A0A4V6NH36_HYDET|nr:sporulation protein YabP [Hydrogenispora ethanolica]TCL73257.1 sporulation protein YabP [Hydrogenispora ethanolica]